MDYNLQQFYLSDSLNAALYSHFYPPTGIGKQAPNAFKFDVIVYFIFGSDLNDVSFSPHATESAEEFIQFTHKAATEVKP